MASLTKASAGAQRLVAKYEDCLGVMDTLKEGDTSRLITMDYDEWQQRGAPVLRTFANQDLSGALWLSQQVSADLNDLYGEGYRTVYAGALLKILGLENTYDADDIWKSGVQKQMTKELKSGVKNLKSQILDMANKLDKAREDAINKAVAGIDGKEAVEAMLGLIDYLDRGKSALEQHLHSLRSDPGQFGATGHKTYMRLVLSAKKVLDDGSLANIYAHKNARKVLEAAKRVNNYAYKKQSNLPFTRNTSAGDNQRMAEGVRSLTSSYSAMHEENMAQLSKSDGSGMSPEKLGTSALYNDTIIWNSMISLSRMLGDKLPMLEETLVGGNRDEVLDLLSTTGMDAREAAAYVDKILGCRQDGEKIAQYVRQLKDRSYRDYLEFLAGYINYGKEGERETGMSPYWEDDAEFQAAVNEVDNYMNIRNASGSSGNSSLGIADAMELNGDKEAAAAIRAARPEVYRHVNGDGYTGQ